MARPISAVPKQLPEAQSDRYARRTAVEFARESEGARTMALIRLLVLAAALLFLCAFGLSVLVNLAQPFARALLAALLALPAGALILLVARSWSSLRPPVAKLTQARPVQARMQRRAF